MEIVIKKGKELDFISQIERDGSGTSPVAADYIEMMKEDNFKINSLSLSEKTLIACGFNSFVVRLKENGQEKRK